jgi:hypothetical protein
LHRETTLSVPGNRPGATFIYKDGLRSAYLTAWEWDAFSKLLSLSTYDILYIIQPLEAGCSLAVDEIKVGVDSPKFQDINIDLM